MTPREPEKEKDNIRSGVSIKSGTPKTYTEEVRQ